MAKEFLRAHSVEFDDVKLGDLADPRKTICAHTGGPYGTPTVVIQNEARVGFDPQWMSEQLGLSNDER